MGNAETVETAGQFFSVLKKSKLLTAEQLQRARAAHDESAAPKAIALYLVKREWLTKWQAGQLLAGWYGLKIGKYTLLDQLGKDQTGRLFLADHAQLDRRALVKTLSRRHTSRPEVVDRFLAEASQAASLDHRNILHVYDVCREGDRHYLVLEYVEGRDLQAMVESQGPLPGDEVADYMAQAASGLAHLHSHGMVHRSLRPAALLVDNRGGLKIGDIAVGRLSASTAASGEDAPLPDALQDASYLAPEQTSGEAAVDHRADIYALGCTMYFLLTGRPPDSLRGDDLSGLAERGPVAISGRPNISPGLIGICRAMMAPRPAERCQTAEEVGRLLNQWLVERPPGVAAAPPSRGALGGGAPAAKAAATGAGKPDSAVHQPPAASVSGWPAARRAILRRLAEPPVILALIAAGAVLALLLALLVLNAG